MTKIYALIDRGLLDSYSIDLKSFCNFLNKNKISIAQYRNKSDNKLQIINDLKVLRECFSGTLILNDYIDYLEFANGLHIGQEDLIKYGSIENIKHKLGKKLLGLSTHNLQEIKEANSYDLDYIGLGAYRPTSTKNVLTIGGKELLKIAKQSKHKVAIIGGVKLNDTFDENISYKVIGSDLAKKYLKSK